MDADKKTDLTPYWYTYRNQLAALFESDDEIAVYDLVKGEDKGQYILKIETSSEAKFKVLKKVIKPEVHFGNIYVTAEISYKDDTDDHIFTANDFNILFKGNSLFNRVELAEVMGGQQSFVIFEPQIIQFYNDDIGDYCGNYNETVENTAKAVLNKPRGTFFCTQSFEEIEEQEDCDCCEY